MVYSMTGFGKAEHTFEGTTLRVEIRSLNSRYLDLTFRAPRNLLLKENEVKETVKKKIERGKVTLTLTVHTSDESLTAFQMDQTLINQYAHMLRKAAQEAGLDGPVTLDHVFHFEDVFLSNATSEINEDLWAHVLKTIQAALEDLNQMRAAEGKAIAKDLLDRLRLIESRLASVAKSAEQAVPLELERLRERLQKLLDKTEMDPQRLNMEVTMLADKVDITEELVRFKSHNKLFTDLITGSTLQVGRRLNFLTQEMGREANTMGSKSSQSEIIHEVVSIKEELEKLREQIQNIE